MTRVNQGQVDAVLELPDGTGKAPAVVLLQEYWGLNEQILGQAKTWAAEGFVTIVPDLFHGRVTKDSAEANAWLKALDFPKAVGEIAACVDHVRNHERSTGKVIVTGYCLGGALTFASAVNIRALSAAIAYYGYPGDLDWTKIDAPVQAHVATDDDWVKLENVQKIKDSVKVPMELHVYEAKHAFCNERRPEVYNADACKLAWSRTLAFARQHSA